MQHSTDKTCELCGDTIPRARLEAIPDVRTCVTCQEKLESGIDASAAGDAAPREEVSPVEVEGGLVRKGDWSTNLMQLTGATGEIRSLVDSGKEREASSLVRRMPLEAQAAVVALNQDPEQILSLTGMDEAGRPRYSTEVVSRLPTETIAGLVAADPDEKRYNAALMRSMTPQTFRRAVEETLDPIDDQRLRGKVSWEWMEAVASIDDPNRAARLLRECDTALLEDALVDRLKGRDLNRAAAGVSVFRFFSDDGAGTVRPSRFVGGGNFGRVIDALYDSAPDLIRLVIRRAWERSDEEEDGPGRRQGEEQLEEAEASGDGVDTEGGGDDEDAAFSLWKRTDE